MLNIDEESRKDVFDILAVLRAVHLAYVRYDVVVSNSLDGLIAAYCDKYGFTLDEVDDEVDRQFASQLHDDDHLNVNCIVHRGQG